MIIGGGASGLSAAYELSRTPALRERHELTVVQMGYRLGGKLASGRRLDRAARNEEHGLHVWFGFYDNAFALWREVFERVASDGSLIRGLDDVLEPCRFAPFGRTAVDAYGAWTVLFPGDSARPGDPTPPRPSQVIERLVDVVRTRVQMLRADLGPGCPPEWHDARPAAASGPGWALVDAALGRLREALTLPLGTWSSGLPRPLSSAAHDALRRLAELLLPPVERATRRSPALRAHVYYTLDFCLAVLRALFDPRYGVADDWNLDRLNHLELRALLVECGLARETSESFVLIRGCYDAFFQYEEGDVGRPNFEAGTALRIALRGLLLYRGAAFWLLKCGAGEGLIAPLYRVLRGQGVRFRFFHQLVDLELAEGEGGPVVERLWFVEQARPRGEYRPTFELDGLECWPAEPPWEQLDDGDALRARGDHLESSRIDPDARRYAWTRGVEFDDVVLALPLGAMAPRVGPSPVARLLARDPALARACARLNLVPSIAAQVWLDRPLRSPAAQRPAMLSWAYPFDIWADMTPTLAHERWPERVASVLYLCGTTTPAPAKDALLDAARCALDAQLRVHGPALFPALAEWDQRVVDRYVRVNVDPSDLCDGAAVGSSALRVEADASIARNLVHCGTWARSGLNTTCVEAAVMAGMSAARAIDRDARRPLADRFMQAPEEERR